VLLFGAAGLFGKWIDLPPTVLVLGRVVFAAITLGAGMALWRGGREPAREGTTPIDRRRDTGSDAARRLDGFALPVLGLLLAAHWVSFFHAIQVSSVAVGLLTFATFPIFTALLEPLLPGERFDTATLVAAAVTGLGVALVIPAPEPADPVVRGAFWGVVSGLTFALLALLNRSLVRRRGALDLAFRQDLWAALFLIPFAIDAPRGPTAAEWGLLIVLGVVFTAGAHALFIHALSGVRAGRAAVIASLEPLYGVILAALLLGERPSSRVLAGGALILAAAVWVSRRAHGGKARAAP